LDASMSSEQPSSSPRESICPIVDSVALQAPTHTHTHTHQFAHAAGTRAWAGFTCMCMRVYAICTRTHPIARAHVHTHTDQKHARLDERHTRSEWQGASVWSTDEEWTGSDPPPPPAFRSTGTPTPVAYRGGRDQYSKLPPKLKNSSGLTPA